MYMYYEGIKKKKHMICTNFIRIKKLWFGWLEFDRTYRET